MRLFTPPATTETGRRIKVGTLRLILVRHVCYGTGESIDDIDDVGEIQDRVAWSLARDVLAAGRA